MGELKALSPASGLLPKTIGQLQLRELDPGPMSVLSPFKGQVQALSAAMTAAHGLGFPPPNTTARTDTAMVIWFGRDQALLTGEAPAETLSTLAAVTDQSDAWTVVELDGPDSDQVLARLVPVDLRLKAFPVAATVRSDLMHMQASITRTSETAFRILVFRSMAATLVHDLQTAMEGVAARR